MPALGASDQTVCAGMWPWPERPSQAQLGALAVENWAEYVMSYDRANTS